MEVFWQEGQLHFPASPFQGSSPPPPSLQHALSACPAPAAPVPGAAVPARSCAGPGIAETGAEPPRNPPQGWELSCSQSTAKVIPVHSQPCQEEAETWERHPDAAEAAAQHHLRPPPEQF